jgi:hypothetical protein
MAGKKVKSKKRTGDKSSGKQLEKASKVSTKGKIEEEVNTKKDGNSVGENLIQEEGNGENVTVVKKKRERKVEKELLGIVIFLAILVGVFFVANSVFSSFHTFEYQGLSFTKEKLGEIPVYHYYYYYEDGGTITKYNLYLRNDPREINIPIYGDKVIFDKGKRVFISVASEGLQECPMSVLAIADFSRFLGDNQFDVKGGSPEFWEAGQKKTEWITCENKPRNVVIEIREGEESRIDIVDNCHRITVANCDLLEAVEAYKIQSILDAKEFDLSINPSS